MIFQIEDATLGMILTNEQHIRDVGLNFFINLLAPTEYPTPLDSQVNELLEAIPTMVTPSVNSMLMAPFSIHEIHKVVFSFPPDKASGLYGFTTLFYQSCWDTIGWDLFVSIEESKENRCMLKYFNNTNIGLITKYMVLKTFVDF